MIAASLAVRPATYGDQRQIADLMHFEEHVHRHLDWRAPLDWLGAPFYWVLEDQGQVLAALACPPDPPRVAWIRLFVHSEILSPQEAWSPLWEAARAEITSSGGAQVSAIALKGWFRELLEATHFRLHQNIILLDWTGRGDFRRSSPESSPFIIRRMILNDLPEVTAVDADAFDLLWSSSVEALQKAYSQAIYASVAVKPDLPTIGEGRLIGYQITTGNPFGGHLARLAVRRDSQRNGVGRALLAELLGWLNGRGLSRLTVNTQSDNTASLRLYQKMGFVRTGEVFPVYIQNL